MRHWQGRTKRIVAVMSLGVFWLTPPTGWSRIELPPGTIDLTEFISSAPLIFRGVVVDVKVERSKTQMIVPADARFKVQRWYRGNGGSDADVHYETGFHSPGHLCLDFQPGTYWLVFATEKDGHWEFVDDCYGAQPVSSVIASALRGSGIVDRMEADLEAGLADPERRGRLVSLQALGGIKSTASRPALHQIIDRGDSVEKDWATYATLRSGDTTVLGRIREMFLRGEQDVPACYLGWELSQLKDKSAIPGLIEIVKTVQNSCALVNAMTALGRTMRASEALPAIASHLADVDAGVRFSALNAMSAVTSQPQCTLPLEPRWTQDMVEPTISQCLNWWNQTGTRMFAIPK